MKISINWLKKYIDFDLSSDDLAHKLTMSGLEVESIEEIGKDIQDFVIGEVLEVEKHPNADKLTVCKVNDGNTIHQIVCGAPNVAKGQRIVLGLAGTIVPHNQHSADGEPFKLEKAKIRGVQSSGMICSEYELGIGDDKDGILVLPESAPLGIRLPDFLGIRDTVFEIGITPNRGDALNHLGVARDIAAILNKPLKYPEITLAESSTFVENHASVEIIDSEGCPRYCARVIKNVKLGESPEWMKKALKSVGLRPINNIVDVTNFVLMEFGHPLHSFDYDLLKGHKIIVKRAKEEEKFITLDNKEHKLKGDTLLICDAERPVALAGVMGGLNSEINPDTKNVLLESAYFDPKSIRRTSKFLGISSDSSYRFERGADPNICETAINRAAQLILETAGGELLKGVINIYPERIKEKEVNIRVSRTNFVLGSNVSTEEIITLLERLGINLKAKVNEDEFTFIVPTFRPDIEREIDLIEEVARIYGYNNIPDSFESNIKFVDTSIKADHETDIKIILSGNGFNEIITNSMLDKKLAELFSNELAEVINPISQTMTIMRPSLIPSALLTVKRNFNIGESNLKFFEIGNIFSKKEGEDYRAYSENNALIMVITGENSYTNWNEKARNCDFYDIKGEIEYLFSKIKLDSFRLISYSLDKYALDIEIDGKKAGCVKKVENEILEQFDINQDVFIAELLTEPLYGRIKNDKRYKSPIKYPVVKRDVAFIIDEKVKVDEIQKSIKAVSNKYLSKIVLFDIFSGGKLEKGKKNVAFSLEFISEAHSLTSEEVDVEFKKIVDNLKEKYQALLREF